MLIQSGFHLFYFIPFGLAEKCNKRFWSRIHPLTSWWRWASTGTTPFAIRWISAADVSQFFFSKNWEFKNLELRRTKTGRRARILVAVAWILSAIFSSPMLVLYEEGLVQGQVQCWIDFTAPWQWQLYLTLVAVSLLVLPALLIFACYIVIVRTIWVQSAALTSSMPSANRNNNNTAGKKIVHYCSIDFSLYFRSSTIPRKMSNKKKKKGFNSAAIYFGFRNKLRIDKLLGAI